MKQNPLQSLTSPSKVIMGNPTVPTSTGLASPGKHLQMRSQCIEQLDKWHSLLERGGITPGQYDDLRAKIFKDMQML